MKAIYIDFRHNSDQSLYVQLFEYLRDSIIRGDIKAGERLPSLRELAKLIGVSITTCSRAYDQLLIEGYVDAKPQSGYYVNDLPAGAADIESLPSVSPLQQIAGSGEQSRSGDDIEKYYCDPECFDFVKWKKCASAVMTDQQEALFSPADPQGEYALRYEISRYLYRARGVTASPEQIVISAGVQQLTGHLARILTYMKIDLVNVEDPGYKPVRHIFRDRGFTMNKIPVRADGIEIERLPVNLESAVYVSPSNQFPTGSVMPAARRYSLLKWAADNGSVIIEDDYDSELRYFGDPVPALKSIDMSDSVVYLGSFSSTLFPAVRISYMVLPEKLAGYFDAHKKDYDQTCSKIEQLTLASFMASGYYQQGIRKIRKLYARKLSLVIKTFRKYGKDFAQAENTKSGISVRLRVKSDKTAAELCEEAGSLKLHMMPFEDEHEYRTAAAENDASSADDSAASDNHLALADSRRLIFYYDQIPEDTIEPAIRELCNRWAE